MDSIAVEYNIQVVHSIWALIYSQILDVFGVDMYSDTDRKTDCHPFSVHDTQISTSI